MNHYDEQCRCFCTFIPPHILEHMAKSSEEVVRESVREAARVSMIQDTQMRLNRAGQPVDIASLLPPRSVGGLAIRERDLGRAINLGPCGAGAD